MLDWFLDWWIRKGNREWSLRQSFLPLGETFFICWITLPADLKKRDLKKKKLVRKQIDNKFPNIGILLFPWKNVMFLFVKFLTYVIMQCYLIKKSSLANITWVRKITVFYDLFHNVFFFSFFCDRRSEKFHLV